MLNSREVIHIAKCVLDEEQQVVHSLFFFFEKPVCQSWTWITGLGFAVSYSLQFYGEALVPSLFSNCSPNCLTHHCVVQLQHCTHVHCTHIHMNNGVAIQLRWAIQQINSRYNEIYCWVQSYFDSDSFYDFASIHHHNRFEIKPDQTDFQLLVKKFYKKMATI